MTVKTKAEVKNTSMNDRVCFPSPHISISPPSGTAAILRIIAAGACGRMDRVTTKPRQIVSNPEGRKETRRHTDTEARRGTRLGPTSDYGDPDMLCNGIESAGKIRHQRALWPQNARLPKGQGLHARVRTNPESYRGDRNARAP